MVIFALFFTFSVYYLQKWKLTKRKDGSTKGYRYHFSTHHPEKFESLEEPTKKRSKTMDDKSINGMIQTSGGVKTEDREEEPEQWEPSGFARKIIEIAEEESDFISRETIRELEEMVRPNKRQMFQSYNYSVVSTLSKPGKTVTVTQEDLNTLKTVTSVVKKMVEVGKFVLSGSEPLLKYLGPIGTAAGILKDVIELFDEEKEDPVMKEFAELRSQLSALSKQMSVQFDDLKSFVTEQDFYGKYTVAVTTLNMYLIDTIRVKTEESVALFKEFYLEERPQKLVYKMLANLEIDASNPLKWAMRGDSLQTKATFEKWRELLESVLSQALFIETFASGLFKTSQHGMDMIVEKMGRYFELVKEWDHYYLNNPDYWPRGVEHLVNEVHKDRHRGSIDEKASKIMDYLNTVHTNDKFYVVVFETKNISVNHANYARQLIVTPQNGLTILVWRSNDYNRIMRHLDDGTPFYTREYLKRQHLSHYANFAHTKFEWKYWDIAKDWARSVEGTPLKTIIRNGGLVLAVVHEEGERVACKSSTLNRWDYGPGFFANNGKLSVFTRFFGKTYPVFWLYGL